MNLDSTKYLVVFILTEACVYDYDVTVAHHHYANYHSAFIVYNFLLTYLEVIPFIAKRRHYASDAYGLLYH